MTKKNTHNLRLIKQDCGYKVLEIADLFDIHIATVRNWLNHGLKKIDNRRPFMVFGGDLYTFVKKKQQDRKSPCKTDQFYCMKCCAPVRAKNRTVMLSFYGHQKFQMSAKCETCNTKVFKAGSHRKMAQYEKFFVISTQVDQHLTGCDNTSVKTHLKENKNDKELSPRKHSDQMELFPLSEGGGRKSG